MTVGEINGDDFFDALVDGQIKGTKEKIVSVFFFALFIIVMPIIIMNLLVGKSVVCLLSLNLRVSFLFISLFLSLPPT